MDSLTNPRMCNVSLTDPSLGPWYEIHEELLH